MATELFSNPRLVSFILSEASAFRSRENGIVTQAGAEVKSGTVVTKVDTATTGSAVATAGNTGNPTFGAIAAGAAAIAGTYTLTFTAATTFDVEDPNGVTIGSGDTGVAFDQNGVGFTLTAGATPAVAGDEWIITVAAGSGKYIPYTASGAAGPANGICYTYLPLATGDFKAVIITDDCEVNRELLTGLDATAEVDLRKQGIKVRGTAGLATVSTPAL